jgi:anaerobic selenocysteine-containing dehydrogenase
VAIAPDSSKVQRGFEREDLFTVVLEHFQTDTADYADILLPATTQLEHVDAHLAYGHLYMMANNAAIAPLGEAKPNTEIFRLLAKAMGFD